MRILWVKTSPLHPLTRGGDLRTYHLLKSLHQRHDVVYAGMVADDEQAAGTGFSAEYCREAHWVRHRLPRQASAKFLLEAMWNHATSPMPYAVSRFRSGALRAQVGWLLKRERFDLLLCDFLFPAASLPWDMREAHASTRWVLFQHNVESLIWERRAQGRHPLSAWYWKQQAARMKRFESNACAQFDGVLTVSASDARILRRDFGLHNVLGDVPTGVDVDYFRELPRRPSTPTKVVFVGSMDWHANVDAVLHFAEQIWPGIRPLLPEAVFQVVGRRPPACIQELASPVRGIEVTGTVPDVRGYMRGAQVMVVPLRIGGGTRLKIYEAMAAELPVVSTSIGAEGLPVEHGRHLLLADEPHAFAAAVVKLCHDAGLARNLAAAALEEVVHRNTWEAAARQMEHLCSAASPEPAAV